MTDWQAKALNEIIMKQPLMVMKNAIKSLDEMLITLSDSTQTLGGDGPTNKRDEDLMKLADIQEQVLRKVIWTMTEELDKLEAVERMTHEATWDTGGKNKGVPKANLQLFEDWHEESLKDQDDWHRREAMARKHRLMSELRDVSKDLESWT